VAEHPWSFFREKSCPESLPFRKTAPVFQQARGGNMEYKQKTDYIIAGNWKMNKTIQESIDFVSELSGRIQPDPRVEVLVFPPYPSLYPLRGLSDKISIGAQNIFYEEKGAFTGEVSPLMLKDLVSHVLIGHSERRQIFKENDSGINKKVKTALIHGFKVVLCLGETLEERENQQTFSRIKSQIEKDLDGIDSDEIQNMILAYEPIWAIGTGKNATPDQAQEVHAFIREVLGQALDDPSMVRILYGGSVKPENSLELLSQPDINGVLVGGASLNVESFFGIISQSIKLIHG
jgi:triosephosphate isomerase